MVLERIKYVVTVGELVSTVTSPSLKETCTVEAPKEHMLGVRGSAEAHSKRAGAFWRCRDLFHVCPPYPLLIG